jgi:hypothetical protein
MQRRSQKGFFTRYQLFNKQFWIAMAASLFFVLVIIYNPLVAPYFRAGPLSLIDWLFALAAAGLFLIIREVQRHANKHHSRRVVLDLLNQTI